MGDNGKQLGGHTDVVGSRDSGEYDSRTEAQRWSTAARIGKEYAHTAPVSDNANKSADRPDDGYVTSHQYAQAAKARQQQRAPDFSPGGRPPGQTCDSAGSGAARTEVRGSSGRGSSPQNSSASPKFAELDYHHPLEDWLGRWWMRKILGYVSKRRPDGASIMEDIIKTYAAPGVPLGKRLKYWPFHAFIRWLKGNKTDEAFRLRVAEHTSTLRGLVATAQSVAEFGLTIPQRWSVPLFSVWNFTNQCNLSCRHCYQDSAHKALPNELSLEEKLDVVDQMGEMYVAMLAVAGGEPTLSPHLIPVLKRCQHHGIHTSIATNGTTMTPKMAADLAETGLKYVEISLDSVDPKKHDAFRGQPGMWQRAVAGMKNVVAQEGIRLGVAMCIHQGNVDEFEDMLKFALDIGASCFAHFNFIPVGRGLEMVEGDITPKQREHILRTLNDCLQTGKMGVMSTAPYLGRVCLTHSPLDGLQSCSHTGSGGGLKAKVVAKYLGGCGAGRTYIAIEPDGTVTPCVYIPHRVLGNVRQRRLYDIFRNNEFWELLCDRDRRLHHCEVCEFKSYCGGCRARADAYYGELNAGDPGCIFNEKHWDDLVARGVAVGSEPVASKKTTAEQPAGTMA